MPTVGTIQRPKKRPFLRNSHETVNLFNSQCIERCPIRRPRRKYKKPSYLVKNFILFICRQK
nr:MAG TPA: hypothetical protein [Caudoviricetes sp.]